jgi:hypothetical protein
MGNVGGKLCGGHAGRQVGLGAVQEHRDMSRRDAQRARHVLARDLVEHAQDDHRALRVDQLTHAARELLVLLDRLQDLLAAGRRIGQLLDDGGVGQVRTRPGVQAPPVARQVASQRHQQLARRLGLRDQLGRVGPHQERAEGLLDGVEGVLGEQALAARHPRQRGAVVVHQTRHPAGECRLGRLTVSARRLAGRAAFEFLAGAVSVSRFH